MDDLRISYIAGEKVISSSGVEQIKNKGSYRQPQGNLVHSAQTDADDETEDDLSFDADDNDGDDNGSDDDVEFEQYMDTGEESDELSPKNKDISAFYKQSIQSISQGKEVKGLTFKNLTRDTTSCKEGSKVAQYISVQSSTQRKTFMGPKSAKERWVKKIKARQEAAMEEAQDAQLDSEVINLAQDVSNKISEQEFSDDDSGGDGVARSACVDSMLGIDNMDIETGEGHEGSGVSVESPSTMGETANVEGGDL